MKAYITKYALTSGVMVKDVYTTDSGLYAVTTNHYETYSKKDVFFTEKEAIADVLQRIDRQRKSLNKKLDKMRNLEIKMLQEGFGK